MQLACAVERTEDEVTVVLAGGADLATIDQLRDALFDAVRSRPARVVVDLRGLVFIDSMSIAALVAARRAALEHGADFAAAHPRGRGLWAVRALARTASLPDRPAVTRSRAPGVG